MGRRNREGAVAAEDGGTLSFDAFVTNVFENHDGRWLMVSPFYTLNVSFIGRVGAEILERLGPSRHRSGPHYCFNFELKISMIARLRPRARFGAETDALAALTQFEAAKSGQIS